jgi:hypothetical protein
MRDKRPTNWEELLDPDKLISRRQYRMIKAICGNEHFIRAESVARCVFDKNLLEISQTEAHELIKYLDRYESKKKSFSFEELDEELGKALVSFDPKKSLIPTEIRLLCLLALHRVATPGQVARFLFGVAPITLSGIRELAEPVLEKMVRANLVGREKSVALRVAGKSVKTEVYFLSEEGSDALHQTAPSINYYARPGLPRHNRIYHELCVLEARLDLQSHLNLDSYDPEIAILSEQQKLRNRRKLVGTGLEGSLASERGCGDFRARVVDPITGKCRRVEVEVIIRSRARELAAKPSRITNYYAASLHRCFLIELRQQKFAKLVPNVMSLLAESIGFTAPHAAARETVSEERLSKVRAAFERMGGVATAEAIAAIADLKMTTVSEALALLAARDEIGYCDGFPATGKMLGRNLRLYLRKEIGIHSIYEFARLLTASKLVSSGIVDVEFRRALRPVGFEPVAGILLLNSPEEDLLVIAIMDDPSELTCRVVRWAEAAYQQALEIGDRNRILIATSGQSRAEELRAISPFKILNIETATKSISQVVRRQGQIKKKRLRKRKRRDQRTLHSG